MMRLFTLIVDKFITAKDNNYGILDEHVYEEMKLANGDFWS